jgi:MFS transporter, DHA1 family, multidrug resistance protein
MKLKPGSAALILVLALLTSMGPLATDMYLPSLPAIASAFATDAGEVQLTLSVFLVGFALGQIVYGPVADHYGRKPVLLAGLILFVAASFACMAATSIATLIARGSSRLSARAPPSCSPGPWCAISIHRKTPHASCP